MKHITIVFALILLFVLHSVLLTGCRNDAEPTTDALVESSVESVSDTEDEAEVEEGEASADTEERASKAATTASGSNFTIVVVDIKAIFDAHPSSKEAQKKLESEQTRLQKKAESLSAEQTEENMQAMFALQQELQEFQNKLMDDVLKKIERDVQQVAQKKGYDVVMDKNSVISGGKDVTSEILSEIRKR